MSHHPGTGKSTLIDAITFALYGSVARYDDRNARGAGDQPARAPGPGCGSTSSSATRRYTVVRVVQRTAREPRPKTPPRARRGAARRRRQSRHRARSTRLLGLDVDQFNRTVVLPQGRFADFLHANPADRQATLRQLLGFGHLPAHRRCARQRAAVARNQLDALRPDLDERGRADGRATEPTARRRRRRAGGGARRRSSTPSTSSPARRRAGRRSVDLAAGHARRSSPLLAALPHPRGWPARRPVRGGEADVAQQRPNDWPRQRRRRRPTSRSPPGPDLGPVPPARQLHRASAAAAGEPRAAATAADRRRRTPAPPWPPCADDGAATPAGSTRCRRGRAAAERAAREPSTTGPNPARVEHWIDVRERRDGGAQAVAAAGAAAAGRADARPAGRRVGRAEARGRAPAPGATTCSSARAPPGSPTC